jgi:lipoate synthase
MAEIVVIPEALRSKLGDDGTKELVNLINQVTRGAKEVAVELMVERFERRLAETKTELVRWMFVFWVGQIAVMIGLLSFFYNLLK